MKSTEDNEKPVKPAASKAASVNTDGESGKAAEEDDIVRAARPLRVTTSSRLPPSGHLTRV